MFPVQLASVPGRGVVDDEKLLRFRRLLQNNILSLLVISLNFPKIRFFVFMSPYTHLRGEAFVDLPVLTNSVLRASPVFGTVNLFIINYEILLHFILVR